MASYDDVESHPDPSVDRKLIRKFREQIHALGGLWIILGSLAGVLGIVALLGNPELAAQMGGNQQMILMLIVGMGIIWFVLGVLSCLKVMWAVYVALGLSYLSLVGQILNVNLCSIVILIIVILQAHRVINWANQMHAKGIPLSAKP